MKQVNKQCYFEQTKAYLMVGFCFLCFCSLKAAGEKEDFFFDRLLQQFEEEGSFQRFDGIPATQDLLVQESYWFQDLNQQPHISANVFHNQERQGVVLASKSEGKVNEQTKYIFNNTEGTEVKDVFTYAFRNIFSFIVIRYQTPEGKEEFSTTFSAYLNKDKNFTIESHWDSGAYPNGYSFYNFQVWADNLIKLDLLVDEIIQSLNEEAPIGEIYTTKEPSIFIAQQSEVSGMIILDIINKSQLKNAQLSGKKKNVGAESSSLFNYDLQLTGALKEKVTFQNDDVELMINGSLGIKEVKEGQTSGVG